MLAIDAVEWFPKGNKRGRQTECLDSQGTDALEQDDKPLDERVLVKIALHVNSSSFTFLATENTSLGQDRP